MGHAAVNIPEKLYFKIGEVCDLVGVQAHVLRYWETEFPQLAPQKNRSGQRSYRRKDVEISLRIKELLYDDMYTIAGARKKLQSELREPPKLKIVHPEPAHQDDEIELPETPGLFDDENSNGRFSSSSREGAIEHMSDAQREALSSLSTLLHELSDILKSNRRQ